MKVLTTRNVHAVLPEAICYLLDNGVQRDSRNGPVLMAPGPVTTVYHNPCERVLFWPERDANPFFHLYESLWMLAGRNDVAGVVRFAKNMAQYSDDGKTFHGPYGYRWRKTFNVASNRATTDQLASIAQRLKKNPEDRRSVLQMWDTILDLDKEGLDFPCNLTATFQRDVNGKLDLTVFCRSNDILWGAYGANSVHFSMLQEYMAGWIGCPVGRLNQVSVNWHAYLNTLEPVKSLVNRMLDENPYAGNQAIHIPIPKDHEYFDAHIKELMMHVDTDFQLPRQLNDDELFIEVCYAMFRAHHVFKTIPKEHGAERQIAALDILNKCANNIDWIRAGKEWIKRRQIYGAKSFVTDEPWL